MGQRLPCAGRGVGFRVWVLGFRALGFGFWVFGRIQVLTDSTETAESSLSCHSAARAFLASIATKVKSAWLRRCQSARNLNSALDVRT